MDKLIAFLKQFNDAVWHLWNQEKYVRACLLTLALPLGAGAIIAVFWLLFSLIFTFLLRYWLDALVIIGLPVSLVVWASTHKKEKGTLPSPPPSSESVELLMTRAKQGLSALTEIVFAVLGDVANYVPGIIRPTTLSEMPCPSTNACIRIINGVAVSSFMVHYTGDVDVKMFKEAFQARLLQRLDARDLPNAPNAVFYDSKNRAYTAIQCINAADCGGYIKFDVVLVTENAVPMLDAMELAKTRTDSLPPAPPTSPYF